MLSASQTSPPRAEPVHVEPAARRARPSSLPRSTPRRGAARPSSGSRVGSTSSLRVGTHSRRRPRRRSIPLAPISIVASTAPVAGFDPQQIRAAPGDPQAAREKRQPLRRIARNRRDTSRRVRAPGRSGRGRLSRWLITQAVVPGKTMSPARHRPRRVRRRGSSPARCGRRSRPGRPRPRRSRRRSRCCTRPRRPGRSRARDLAPSPG